jgi:hypothetical protein
MEAGSERRRHSLVPFELAVLSIYHRIYSPPPAAAAQPEQLDAFAAMVAALVPLYTYTPDASEPARELTLDELDGALYRGGGRSAVFLDKRAPITPLAMDAGSVNGVVQFLQFLRAR